MKEGKGSRSVVVDGKTHGPSTPSLVLWTDQLGDGL